MLDGRPLHVRRWGAPGAPGVVLVHGGGAHSGWWDHVAPLLAARRCVVAVDLSGHGDSARSDTYSVDRWADELRAVVERVGLDRPVLVGHSLGGWVGLTLAARHPDLLDGLVVVDSPLLEQPPDVEQLRRRRRDPRVYASREEAAARFTTIPPQDVLLPDVARHVARESLKQVEGGWTWKFDPTMFGQRPPLRDALPEVRCRTALLRCEHGLMTEAMAATMSGLLPDAVVLELPDCGHHPVLDRPLVLTGVLRTLLAVWQPVS